MYRDQGERRAISVYFMSSLRWKFECVLAYTEDTPSPPRRAGSSRSARGSSSAPKQNGDANGHAGHRLSGVNLHSARAVMTASHGGGGARQPPLGASSSAASSSRRPASSGGIHSARSAASTGRKDSAAIKVKPGVCLSSSSTLPQVAFQREIATAAIHRVIFECVFFSSSNPRTTTHPQVKHTAASARMFAAAERTRANNGDQHHQPHRQSIDVDGYSDGDDDSHDDEPVMC